MTVVADKRVWHNSDRSKVVEDGHPDAAFLLCSPGDELTDEAAKEYGVRGAKSAPKPVDKQAAPAANKSGVTVTKRG